jgi:outer membrane receptor protein involved in Fe transport
MKRTSLILVFWGDFMELFKRFTLLFTFLTGLIGSASIIAAEEDSEAKSGIEEVIVTARRTEESLQDVPIAISAFNEEGLEAKQIIGATDLQLNVPNVSFTPTNFGSSSFSIRGVGRLVTAGSGEAGVSVHTNDIPITGNLNTGEFFDMERVEVLRGPQGTLFGKNATGGVVNFITRKPEMGNLGGYAQVETGNYNHQRTEFALNVPLGDAIALRLAGSDLSRDGYTRNLFVESDGDIDGRNQNAIRLSLRWEGEDTTIDFMHADGEEDSDRARITNQVCKQNPLPTYGCTPNEFGRDGVNPSSTTGTLYLAFGGGAILGANTATLEALGQFQYPRPKMTSLRDVHTDFEPTFDQEGESTFLTINHDLDNYRITLNLATAEGSFDAQQDYNMDVGPNIQTVNALTGLPTPCAAVNCFVPVSTADGNIATENALTAGVIGGNVYGAYNRVFSYDRAYTDYSDTNYAEIKIASDFDGNFNFTLGANYGDNESLGGYYVMANSLDFITLYGLPTIAGGGIHPTGVPPLFPGYYHSDTLSESETTSFFGEAYFDITDKLRLTVGARRNEDEKDTKGRVALADCAFIAPGTCVRSSLTSLLTGAPPTAAQLALLGYYGAASPLDVPPTPGYNETRTLTGSPDHAEFSATTGRVGLDYQASDDLMVYVTASKGHKPGGFNPSISDAFPADTPRIFDSEEVDAVELGFKSTRLDGRMTLNGSIFQYDYKGLQIYKIINNSSVNVNVDAEIEGAELEMLYIPDGMPNTVIDVAMSWLNTEAADNLLLDPKNRLQDTPNWRVMKNIDPGSSTGINYVAFAPGALAALPIARAVGAVIETPASAYSDGLPAFYSRNALNAFGVPTSDGFLVNIKGNELPNSPGQTIKVGVQHTWNMDAFDLTARVDYYEQSKSYAREFNDIGDEIPSFSQVNMSLSLDDPEGKWRARAWVRNLKDKEIVTGHYTTSDTSGLYTNYYLTEPRIYGVTFTRNF